MPLLGMSIRSNGESTMTTDNQDALIWTRDRQANCWRARNDEGFHFVLYRDGYRGRGGLVIVRVYREPGHSSFDKCIAISKPHTMIESAKGWAERFDYGSYLDNAIPEAQLAVRNAASSLTDAIDRLHRLQEEQERLATE